MPDYKKMYHILFNQITDTGNRLVAARLEEEAEGLKKAVEEEILALQEAQKKTEEQYLQ